jgi:hypothetical protein
MIKFLSRSILILALAFAASPLFAAVSAPSGLTAGPIWGTSLPITWNYDSSIANWYVYVNGTLIANPTPSSIVLDPTGTYANYRLTSIPMSATQITITMTAQSYGGPMSVSSSPLVVNLPGVPFTYVVTPPNVPLAVPPSTVQYSGTFIALSTTATNLNLTTTAGSNSKLLVSVSSVVGGNLYFDFTNASYAASTLGTYPPFSATAGVSGLFYGPYAAGTYLHVIGSAASVTGTVHLESVP